MDKAQADAIAAALAGEMHSAVKAQLEKYIKPTIAQDRQRGLWSATTQEEKGYPSAPSDARSTWAEATAQSPSSPETPVSTGPQKADPVDLFAFLRKQAKVKITEPLALAVALGMIDRLEKWLR